MGNMVESGHPASLGSQELGIQLCGELCRGRERDLNTITTTELYQSAIFGPEMPELTEY